VAFITRATDTHTGIGRYVEMLDAGLQQTGVKTTRVAPTLPALPKLSYRICKLFGRDLHAFLKNYPLWLNHSQAEIYHVTEQTLASSLLLCRPNGKVVVTVHDIFPYLLHKNPNLTTSYGRLEHIYYRLPVAGLKRANHLIAISEYTKRCI